MADLALVPGLIAEVEAQEGMLTRVWGLFSLVNLMWLGAIIGITLSLGPVMLLLATKLYRLFKPLLLLLKDVFTTLARLTRDYLVPIFINLHLIGWLLLLRGGGG